jgi:hypothetical protein
MALSLSSINPGHTNVESYFEARGVAQPNNWKWALRASGENPGTVTNPGGASFWNATRYWRLSYNEAAESWTWSLFSDSARTNLTTSVTRPNGNGSFNSTLTPPADKQLVGLQINVRANDSSKTATVDVSDVRLNGTLIPTMSNSITAKQGDATTFKAGLQHFFAAPPTESFVLEGITTMSWSGSLGSGSSDRVSFDVKGLAANPVPEPGTMAALGLGIAALWRRRRTAKA